jgi:hypothetical protein
LISPRRGGVYLEAPNGIMEWWKNGILGMKSGKYLIFNLGFLPCILKKSHSSRPIIPIFHYSNTPWHLITAEPPVSDPCNAVVFQVRMKNAPTFS